MYTKHSLLSHLSWVSTSLRFHILAIFMHNDCVSSFAKPWATLNIEPIICEQLKVLLALKTHSTSNLFIVPLTLQTHLVTFSHLMLAAFGLPVSLLVVLKASFDSLGSRIIPDKSKLWLRPRRPFKGEAHM